MKPFLRSLAFFRVPLLLSLAVFAGVYLGLGPQAAATAVLLSLLEVSLSFDNAVINASVLKRMSPFWQRLFLTAGILVAVFGMRILLPIAIVAATAHLGFDTVVDLVLHDPAGYGHHLEAAHPSIAAFGGAFLLMVFLDFVLDRSKETHWLKWIEKPLARFGQLESLSIILTLVALLYAGEGLAKSHGFDVLVAGVTGLACYLAVKGVGTLFETFGGAATSDDEAVKMVERKRLAVATGRAAFALFAYLEVLDASFSFDGVVGAFAMTTDLAVIAAGLGVGALFIRSLTVYLVRQNTLSEYVYLEHGAHYAIGSLAVLLLASIAREIPEAVTGGIGLFFLATALGSSLIERKRRA